MALIDITMLIFKSTHIAASIKRDIYANGYRQLSRTCFVLSLVCYIGLLESIAQGTRSASIASLSSTLTENPWAVLSNPAGMPSAKWISMGVQRNFGISELNEAGISIGYPIHKKLTYSAALTSNGWEKMRFMRLNHGFSYANERLNIGLALNTVGMFLPRPYRTDWAIQLNGGAQYHLNDELSFGFHAINLGQSKWKKSDDLLEQNLSIGLSWKAISTIRLHLQHSVSDHFRDDEILALEWLPKDGLALGIGAGTQPKRLSFGLNIKRGSQQFGWMASNYSRISKAWIQAAEIGVLR